MKTTAGILRAAVDVIDERGWTQGYLQDSELHVCLVGALHVAGGSGHPMDTPRDAFDWAAYTKACNALARHLRLPGTAGLVTWNDAPGRRAAEVRAALLAAADEAEQQG